MRYGAKENLFRHHETVHFKLWFFCPSMCGKKTKDGRVHVETFTRPGSLKRHVERVSSGDEHKDHIHGKLLFAFTYNLCSERLFSCEIQGNILPRVCVIYGVFFRPWCDFYGNP